MSHLHERKEKNCLNCQGELVGRYCHQCGQENLEPKETVWHLVTHFFNDITHFDGKFFETVRFLLRKPGYLSLEYMRGRRMSYLNPIRMYVFTSAIFFIILFSFGKPEKMARESALTTNDVKITMDLGALRNDTSRLKKDLAETTDDDDKEDIREKLAYRQIQIATIEKDYADSPRKKFDKDTLNAFVARAYTDSLAAGNYDLAKQKRFKHAMRNFGKQMGDQSGAEESFELMGWTIHYHDAAQYDSAERALPDSLRDGWLKHWLIRRSIEIRGEFREDRRLFMEHLIDNIFHSFPKILWISLPIFALILNALYFRHKKYFYVNHGIFTIHFYCATFIQLFFLLMLYEIAKSVSTHWIKALIFLVEFAVVLWMIIYPYKAMRGFYQQRRAKTFLKYVIVFSTMSFINILLLAIFLMISVFSV